MSDEIVMMRHRVLPGQSIPVPAGSVPGYEASGWVIAKKEAPDTIPVLPPTEDADASDPKE